MSREHVGISRQIQESNSLPGTSADSPRASTSSTPDQPSRGGVITPVRPGPSRSRTTTPVQPRPSTSGVSQPQPRPSTSGVSTPTQSQPRLVGTPVAKTTPLAFELYSDYTTIEAERSGTFDLKTLRHLIR